MLPISDLFDPLNPFMFNQRGRRLYQQLSAMVARAPYEPDQSTQVANTSNKQTQVATSQHWQKKIV